jgi:hypothetical protein
MRSPVSMRYRALPCPTTRVIRWVPPSTHGTPHLPVEGAELGSFSSDPEVAPARQLDAAADAEPFDRRDPRLPRLQPGEAERPGPGSLRAPHQLVDGVEVGPGTGRPDARTGHHQDPRFRVGGEGLDTGADESRGLTVHAVVNLGPIQRQDGDRPPPLDEHLRSGHGRPMIAKRRTGHPRTESPA